MGMNRGNPHFLKACGVASKLCCFSTGTVQHKYMKCTSTSTPTVKADKLHVNSMQLELLKLS